MIQHSNIQENRQKSFNQAHQNHNFKYLKPSPIFVSKSQRSQFANNSISPGPAAYQIPSKDIQRTSLYRKKTKSKDQSSLFNKQHLWIIEDRFRTVTQKSKHLGPGLYNPQQLKFIKNNSCWGKSKRFIQKMDQISQNIGPGVYQIRAESNLSGGAQSSFKSRSPKFDVQHQNSLSHTILDLQPKLIKSKEYKHNMSDLQTLQILQRHRVNVQKHHQKKKLKSYVFASVLPRFKKDRMSKLGPGCYNSDNSTLINKQQIHKKRNSTIFPASKNLNVNQNQNGSIQTKIRNASYIESNQNPGPNHYKVDQYQMQKALNNNQRLHFAKQTRFDFRKRKVKSVQQLPGPGHYNQNRFVFLNRQEYFCGKKESQNGIAFLSGEGKNSHILSKNYQNIKQPFGYNTNISDIQSKMLKKKEHLQKLKIMQVQLAAFNTKQKRF